MAASRKLTQTTSCMLIAAASEEGGEKYFQRDKQRGRKSADDLEFPLVRRRLVLEFFFLEGFAQCTILGAIGGELHLGELDREHVRRGGAPVLWGYQLASLDSPALPPVIEAAQ